MARTTDIDFEEGASSRRFVTALSRGLEVLACFNTDETWLTNTELARRTQLPKPTIARLAYTLCVLGYLRHSSDTGKYAIGNSMIALGMTMVSNLRLRRIARPYMQELAEQYDCSVSLAIRHELSMVYVENCRSNAPLSLGLDIGSRIPIGRTALGRALLCVLDAKERERLLQALRVSEGERWPQVRAGIDHSMALWRERGFTLSVREWETDIAGVGAAIRLADGNVIAFNVGGSATKLTRELLEQDIGPQLARTVRVLESFVRSEN